MNSKIKYVSIDAIKEEQIKVQVREDEIEKMIRWGRFDESVLLAGLEARFRKARGFDGYDLLRKHTVDYDRHREEWCEYEPRNNHTYKTHGGDATENDKIFHQTIDHIRECFLRVPLEKDD
jgi:hypothetical protein